MKILEDANEYINLQAWARKTIKEFGYAKTEKLKEIINRAIKQKGTLNAFDIKKLEGMSFILIVELNRWRVGRFMAPGIEAIKRVKKYGQEQRQKREKRKTWKGVTREQIVERNQSIIEFYQKTRKSRLTKANLAERYAAKFDLSPRQVRRILSKAIGHLPG